METVASDGRLRHPEKLNLPYLGMETSATPVPCGTPPPQSSLFRNGNSTIKFLRSYAITLNLPSARRPAYAKPKGLAALCRSAVSERGTIASRRL